MHKIEPYHPEIRVINREYNIVAVYDNITECATYIWYEIRGIGWYNGWYNGWYKRPTDIVDDFIERWPYGISGSYIIRTEFDEIVTRDQLVELRPRRSFIKGHRGSYGSGYGIMRRPRTTQERRKYFDAIDQDVEDYNIRINIRGRRRPKSLPNAWDDMYSYKGRGWKNFRKTQYKDK